MSLKLMIVGNQSWDFGNDLDEHFQLSDEETEAQKIVLVVQCQMAITLIMKSRILI